MADEAENNSSSEEDTNDYFKNPMKRRIHDIQKLNLQNKEMLMMAGHNKKLAQSIIKQKNLTKMIQQNQTKNFANTSLCGCTTTSRFRSAIMQIVFNPWFDKFILLTIFANCVCLAIESPGEEPDPVIETLDIVFLVIFSIEMVLKIIAMGFVMEAHSYLRDPWNILDFSVVILGWFSMSAAKFNVSAIRVIRILRPLRTLNSLQGMRGLVLTLLNSLPSMINILILFCFTLVIFGTIGVQLFKGIFRFRCVLKESRNDEDWTYEEYLTDRDGQFLYCQDTKNASFTCPETHECVVRENPDVGLQNWDNIAFGILTQFELITLEGWSEVMYKVRNAHNGAVFTDIFFILSVVFGAFFVLNLMIAVQFNFLDEAFKDVAEQQEKEKKAALAEKQENEEQQKLTDAIIARTSRENGEEIPQKKPKITCKERLKKACACLNVDKKKCCCKCYIDFSEYVRKFVEDESENEDDNGNQQKKPENKKHKWFTSFIVVLILLNSATLATEHYEQEQWLTDVQFYANIVFTILFAIEMVLNLIGLGIVGYVKDGFNIFDAVIVVVSVVDLIVMSTSSGESNDTGFITVLRGFRLLRIFKLVKNWETLQTLLSTIIGSMIAISNLAVLSLLFLFVYSLIGKQFFYGPMIDLEDGVALSRYHFNTTHNAMITMFIVLTGENWNYVLAIVAAHHQTKQVLAIIFFVSAVLIGNFMLLNLFLAILLKYLQDAVDKVRQAKEKEKQSAEFNDARAKASAIDKQKQEEFRNKIHTNDKQGLQRQAKTKDSNTGVNNIPLLNPAPDNNQNPGQSPSPNQSQSNNNANAASSGAPNTHDRILNNLNQDEALVDGLITDNAASAQKLVSPAGAGASGEAAGVLSPGQASSTNAIRGGEPGILRQQVTGGSPTRPKQLKSQKSVGFIVEEQPAIVEDKKADVAGDKSGGPAAIDELGPRRQETDYKTQMQVGEQKVVKKKKRLNEIIIDGDALGCIPETNACRIKLGKFAENPYFEAFIFNLIGLNSLFLAIQEPTLKDQYSITTLEMFGEITSGLFVAECLLKIFVMGFVRGKHSYLRDNYNILDFVIVIVSVLGWILGAMQSGENSLQSLKALRALRALRPLKLVSKNEGMKLVVNSILASIPNLINVFLISVLFYFVFGVLGLSFLMGKVSYCGGEDAEGNSYRYTLDKDACLAVNAEWVLPENNYDNVFDSMRTFFEVSTLETWPDIMFAAIDSQDQPDLHPIKENRVWIALLFISFIFVTTFFVMNLFISVIVGQFNEQKEQSEGSAKLSDEQKEWVKIQRFMAEVKAPVIEEKPENQFRLKIYNLVKKEWFDQYFITAVIVANTITMCMDYYGASEDYIFVLETLNLIFVVIFTMEAVLKLIGYGPTFYFYGNWNKFDFSVVILSLVSLGGVAEDLQITALRIIRVARLLRMIKSSKELQQLLMTLYLAMNNIANVALLFMLIIFTFAVAGMDLFGDIEINENFGAMNYEHVNFNTFYNSVSVLIRSSTGESWNMIMHDCASAKDNSIVTYFYWMLFQLFAFFIFLNVFIAVIYEEFQNVNQVESTLEVLSLKKRDIHEFLNTWGDMNKNGEHYMETTRFTEFMKKLPAPLGYHGLNIDKSKLDKIIFCLNIRDHEGKVYFPEVMWAIFYSIIGKNDKMLHECKPMRNIMRKVKNKYSGLGRNTSLDMLCGNKFYRNDMTITKYLCGRVILQNLRILVKRSKEKKENQNLGQTTAYIAQQREKAKQDSNFLVKLCTAISTKPEQMSTRKYQHEKIMMKKGATTGVGVKSPTQANNNTQQQLQSQQNSNLLSARGGEENNQV